MYFSRMIAITFLGFGNVNSHLCKAFFNSGNVAVKQIYNHREIELPDYLQEVQLVTQLTDLKKADVYIIGIPDDEIAAFSQRLPEQNGLVVHTSGSVDIQALFPHSSRGIFYPLQTFSRKKEINFKNIPICLEAGDASDLVLLQQLGNCISEKVVEINSEQRAQLHLAAVFVNNFVNHLYAISEEILAEKKLDFDLLKPLIAETASKIEYLNPSEAQTGPAKRNDLNTLQKHVALLENSPYREIYKSLTASIQAIQSH